MTTDTTVADFDPIVRAAAEAVEEAAIMRIGRDLGTIHRDEIVAAGVVVTMRMLADFVDNGPTFPMPPSVLSALIRERADLIERDFA